MEGGLNGLIHLIFSKSELCTVAMPARFISSMAFSTSLG